MRPDRRPSLASLVTSPAISVLLALLIVLTLADLYLTAAGSDGARARGSRIIDNQIGAIATIGRIERKLDDALKSCPVAGAECPPYWQCAGRPETNHSDCKCWDAK